jgi:hypothetical protein
MNGVWAHILWCLLFPTGIKSRLVLILISKERRHPFSSSLLFYLHLVDVYDRCRVDSLLVYLLPYLLTAIGAPNLNAT